MDIGFPVGTSVSQCNGGSIEAVSVDDLGNDLTEFLHIWDGHKLASNSILPLSSGKYDSSTVEKEDDCEETHKTVSTFLTSEKCSSKHATFSGISEKATSDVAVDGEEEKDDLAAAVLNQNGCESVKPARPPPILLPTPLKLVSAMKGSREKQGMPQKKLTVKWAPDVYDPPPSPSTTVRIMKPRPKGESKKNGKKKQKGKSSKGASSKDTKQVRKHGGSSNKYYRSVDDYDKAVDYNEPFAKLGDFDVGSPDSYCGSSFLNKSVTKLHFSVTEAT